MSSHTYKNAGVQIDAGNALVHKITQMTQPMRAHKYGGLMTGVGGFGAVYEIPLHRFRQPVLVSSTDGVGTKLDLACQLNQHDTIGIDLVAMCVNDIVTYGAEPLYFLDYYATGRLNPAVAEQVIQGIIQGCKLADMPLVGGETAEMPGFYPGNQYDLAGFCVGMVEKDDLIDGSSIQPGDQLIALASSGLHANGYSLVRHLIQTQHIDLHTTQVAQRPLSQELLIPTRIYVPSVLAVKDQLPIKGMAHITGGGLLENVPRMLPQQTQAVVDTTTWSLPPVFEWIASYQIDRQELYRTFNCGVGLVLCVAPEHVSSCLSLLESLGETAWVVGCVQSRSETECPIKLI